MARGEVSVMIESYCGGRLRRAVQQIDVTAWGDPEPVYIPGPEIWLWDGQEIEPVIARAYLHLFICSETGGLTDAG